MKKFASLFLVAALAVACGDDDSPKAANNNTGGTNNTATNNAATNNAATNNAGTNNAGTNNTGTNNSGTNNTGTNNTGTNNTVAEGCAVTHPGSDIYGVSLEDASGSVLGWAKTVGFIPDEMPNGNDYDDLTVLDGQAPQLDADLCPAAGFTPTSVLALTCWGEIALEFVDAQGARIALEEGQTITVYEYGAECGETGLPDLYDIYLCPGDPTGTNFSQCGDSAGEMDLSGLATAIVPDLGDQSVEFITILDTTD